MNNTTNQSIEAQDSEGEKPARQTYCSDCSKYLLFEAINVSTGAREFVLKGRYWNNAGESVTGGEIRDKDISDLAFTAQRRGFRIDLGDTLATISRTGVKQGYSWITGPVSNDEFFEFYRTYRDIQEHVNEGDNWEDRDKIISDHILPLDPRPTIPPTPLS